MSRNPKGPRGSACVLVSPLTASSIFAANVKHTNSLFITTNRLLVCLITAILKYNKRRWKREGNHTVAPLKHRGYPCVEKDDKISFNSLAVIGVFAPLLSGVKYWNKLQGDSFAIVISTQGPAILSLSMDQYYRAIILRSFRNMLYSWITPAPYCTSHMFWRAYTTWRLLRSSHRLANPPPLSLPISIRSTPSIASDQNVVLVTMMSCLPHWFAHFGQLFYKLKIMVCNTSSHLLLYWFMYRMHWRTNILTMNKV